MTDQDWNGAVVGFDPFAGDYGGAGGGDKVLSDRIVIARKPCACFNCNEMTAPGTRTRVRKEVYDGEFMSFRWCEPCCQAMADQDDDTLESRNAGSLLP